MKSNIISKEKSVRLWECNSPIFGVFFILEKKTWFGIWVQPSITYAEDATFFSKEEAMKWFEHYKSGLGLKVQKHIIADA
jgi:hypothetical protein